MRSSVQNSKSKTIKDIYKLLLLLPSGYYGHLNFIMEISSLEQRQGSWEKAWVVARENRSLDKNVTKIQDGDQASQISQDEM